MNWKMLLLIPIAVLLACGQDQEEHTKDYAGDLAFTWSTATPESQGLSKAKLDAMQKILASKKTTGLLVMRNDKIVYEWYASGYSATKPHYTASMAKALVGGVSMALALGDGRIALTDLASKYVPQWKTGVHATIRVWQLGTHTAGIEDSNPKDTPGWKSDFWARKAAPNDPFTLARDKAPVIATPGTQQIYSNPSLAMVSYVVTAALKGSQQPDMRTLLKQRVMQPIGVVDSEWNVGYNKTFTVDGLPMVACWGGGNYTARATARVGRLMMRQGNWDGQQLIPVSAVKAVTSAYPQAPAGAFAPGIGWWSNATGWLSLPKDTFAALGAGHQVLLVVPSLNLIVVRNGEDLASDFDQAIEDYLAKPLAGALIAPTPDPSPPPSGYPYPASSVITALTWASDSSVTRQAAGDNWPITWGDDDSLYTAYGDGNGFVPYVPTKLSLGLAKVQGAAGSFTGQNIRSTTGEQYGDGSAGKKASGMLMVDGTLYMMVRNASGGKSSQLTWSTDHGKTWSFSGWLFTQFGYLTFLNFGKNYASARDGYVYLYSHDNPSAYDPADRMVLLRVPKGSLKTQSAYQYFVKIDDAGQPVWSSEVSQRGPVFTHKGKCRRSSVVFNAALKRYIWWQGIYVAGEDQRYTGGFGVYDAPEPWGPWSTVYFTSKWDMGPGETATFPTKWISNDGKTMYLVFSGDDTFSVRKASLSVK